MNNKFLTPIITIALLVVGFFQTSISDGEFTYLEKWQVAALFVGAVVTYFTPIVKGPWPGVLKVAGAVIGAALAAIITAVQTGSVFDTNLLTIIFLAGLNAFAAQTGTDARLVEAKAELANPAVPISQTMAADPGAARAVINRGAEVVDTTAGVSFNTPPSPDTAIH